MKEKIDSYNNVVEINDNKNSLHDRARRKGKTALTIVRSFATGGRIHDINEANHRAITEDKFRTVAADKRYEAQHAPSDIDEDVALNDAKTADKAAGQVGRNASRKFKGLVKAGMDPEFIVTKSRENTEQAIIGEELELTSLK